MAPAANLSTPKEDSVTRILIVVRYTRQQYRHLHVKLAYSVAVM